MVLFFEKNIVDFKSFRLGQEYNIYIFIRQIKDIMDRRWCVQR